MQTVLYGSPSKKLKINSMELECYILDDNSRVISKKSLQKALGYDGKSADWLVGFLNGIGRFAYFPEELLFAIDNPIAFENYKDDISIVDKGYTLPIVDVICHFIINAKEDGYLNLGQLKIAKAAEKISNAGNTIALEHQIDEATGYTFFKENAKERFKDFFLNTDPNPVYEWAKTFSDHFFQGLFDYFSINWIQLKNNPQKPAQFVYDTVFKRIPDDVWANLQQTKPKRSYRKKNGGIQNAEHPQLKQYTDALLALLKASGNSEHIFMQLLNRTFPEQPDRVEIDFSEVKIARITPFSLTAFDEKLKKSLSRKAVVKKKP